MIKAKSNKDALQLNLTNQQEVCSPHAQRVETGAEQSRQEDLPSFRIGLKSRRWKSWTIHCDRDTSEIWKSLCNTFALNEYKEGK